MNPSTVLLVDDDEVLGQVLHRVLTRQGCAVIQAGSVAQAVQLAREHRPALGLVDLCLPDGDGVELAGRLEAEVGRLPLILMTAYPLRLRDHPELAQQFTRVLTKPLNLEELRQAVESALRTAHAPAAPPVAAAPPGGERPAPREGNAAGAEAAEPGEPAEEPDEPTLTPAAAERSGHTNDHPARTELAPEAPPAVHPRHRLLATVIGLAVVVAGVFLILPTLGVPGIPNLLHRAVSQPPAPADAGPLAVHILPGRPDTFDLDPDAVRRLEVPPPTPVAAQATARRLEMPGTLAFDPNRLGRIQSRFAGEVIAIGHTQPGERDPKTGQTEPERPLRYGDEVKGPDPRTGVPGQLLAVIWSKDLGEKKSELIDSLVRLHLDEETVVKLERLFREGSTSEAALRQARNVVSTDLGAVARIRRTLAIWRVDKEEVDAVEKEARRIIASKRLSELNRQKPNTEKWARVEVRAPFDGIIVEKNLAVGHIVDTTFDLYKIANLRHLAVYANAYEEDLRTLEELQARYRPRLVPWRVYLAADPSRKELQAPGIERIGYIVDPQQHTNVVMGQVLNPQEELRVGQFITAVVDVPAPPGVVSVPITALDEDGSESVLFVQPDPKRPRYTLRRVVVTQRFQDHAYVRSRLTDQQKKAGLSEVHPGDQVVTGAAVELKAALEEAQSKAKK